MVLAKGGKKQWGANWKVVYALAEKVMARTMAEWLARPKL